MTKHQTWVLCLFLLSIASHAKVNCPNLAITQQPTDLTACIGETAVFTVQAMGDGPLSYQWRKNCLPLFGETSASLTLNDLDFSDYATYSVTVSDNCGVLTSEEVLLNPNEVNGYISPGPPSYYNRTIYFCEGNTRQYS